MARRDRSEYSAVVGLAEGAKHRPRAPREIPPPTGLAAVWLAVAKFLKQFGIGVHRGV